LFGEEALDLDQPFYVAVVAGYLFRDTERGDYW
jgi:hypothetical protein